MATRHFRSKWCSLGAFLCRDPSHWKWEEVRDRNGNVTPLVWDWQEHCVALAHRQTMDSLVDQAMTGNVQYLKALGVLAWQREDYKEWRPTVLSLYRSVMEK
jgi:hypothetical protein